MKIKEVSSDDGRAEQKLVTKTEANDLRTLLTKIVYISTHSKTLPNTESSSVLKRDIQ